jgi:GNAT superfamily N-acetyltransferase
MYDFIVIDNPAQAKDYEDLTFPYYHRMLQELAPDTGILALGVRTGIEPVGLVLATYTKEKQAEKKEAEIYSLFIKPEHRHQGLGTNALKKLEAELRQRGCSRIGLTYTENQHTEKLKSLLVKCGWTEPLNTAILVYACAEKVRTAPKGHLIERAAEFKSKLGAKYEIFPWTELKESEREAIKQRMKTDSLWSRFNPFIGENVTDKVSSYGVRYSGQVIGWTISHNMAPNQTTFATMFITPECPLRPRIALPLMAQAINSCFESGCPKATFRTETSNTPMLKFIERWLTPYIETKRHTWSSQKILDF